MKYCRPVWVGMPAGLRDWLCGELEARGLDPPLASLYARCVISILAAWEKDPSDWDTEFYAGHGGKAPELPFKSFKGLNNKYKDQKLRTKARLKKTMCEDVLTGDVKGVAPRAWLSHMRSRLHFWNDYDGEEMKKSAAVECLLSASDQEWSVEALVDELCTRLKLMQMNGGTWSASAPETSSETLIISPPSVPLEHHSAPEAVDYFSVFPSLTEVVSPITALDPEPVWYRGKGRETKRVPFIQKGRISRKESHLAPGSCHWGCLEHGTEEGESREEEEEEHRTPLLFEEPFLPIQTSEFLEWNEDLSSETDSGVAEVASSLAILHHSRETSDFVEVQPSCTAPLLGVEKPLLNVVKCDVKNEAGEPQTQDGDNENLLTSSKTHFCPIKDDPDTADFEEIEPVAPKAISEGPEEVRFVPTPSGATLYLPALSSSGRNEAEWQRYMVYKASSTSELDIAVKFRVRGTEKCVQTEEHPFPSFDHLFAHVSGDAEVTLSPFHELLSDAGSSASSAAKQLLHVLHTQEQFPFASSSLTKEFEIWKPLDDAFSCWTAPAPPTELDYPCDWPDAFALERNNYANTRTGPKDLGLGKCSIRPFHQRELWTDSEFDTSDPEVKRTGWEEMTVDKWPEGKRQDCCVMNEVEVKVQQEEESGAKEETVEGEEGGEELLAEIWEAVASKENDLGDQLGEVLVEEASLLAEDQYQNNVAAFPEQDWKEADIDLDGLWNPLEGEVDVCEWLVPEEEYQENSAEYSQVWEGDSWNLSGVPVEYLDDDIFDEMFGSLDSNQSLSSTNSTIQASTSNSKSRRHFRRRRTSVRKGKCGGSGTHHTKARPCSFFVEGQCRRVDCKFSHDLGSIVCRFWSEGSCFKGEDCPFKHTNSVRANEESHLGRHEESDVSENEASGSKFELNSDSDFPTLGAAKDIQEGSGRKLSRPRPIPKNSVNILGSGSSGGRKRRRGHRQV